MNGLVKASPLISVIIPFIAYWRSGDDSVIDIIGNVRPTIGLIGQDMILSCQIRGCTSSSLEVYLSKWGESKKNALYIHKSTKQHQVQESSTGNKNGAHRGKFKNGVLEVALLQVQAADSGQYVCAMTCGQVHKQVAMEVIIIDLINVAVGGDVHLPCRLNGILEPSHLKLQLRRISPGKSHTIYSYLYQNTCPVIYSADSLGDKCSPSNGPSIKEWFGKIYARKTEAFRINILKNGNVSIQLSNIHKVDSGKYACSVRSNLFHKKSIFQLNVTVNNTSTKHTSLFSSLLSLYGYLYTTEKGDNSSCGSCVPLWIMLDIEVSILVLTAVGLPIHFILLWFTWSKYKANARKKSTGEEERLISEKKSTNEKEIFITEQLMKENEQLTKEKEQFMRENEQFKREKEFLDARFYRADVVFNPKTAHPRLKVSEDGKHVRDSGSFSTVSKSGEQFDSHLYILAAVGFFEGKHYWEVNVGQKNKWDIGVAAESASRKGKITLSPENEYWAIGLDGGRDYRARTDSLGHIKVSGRPVRIGVFLNMSDQELSFYDAHRKSKLFTFNIPHHKRLYPFFSMGYLTAELDEKPLEIPSWFE